MADYAAIHTVYCAGVNEALKGSGYTITCTRKGYHKVLSEAGAVIAQLANIEFERKGGVTTGYDLTASLNHPTMREDGTALSLSEIKGYQFRTLLISGELSEWVEIPK